MVVQRGGPPIAKQCLMIRGKIISHDCRLVGEESAALKAGEGRIALYGNIRLICIILIWTCRPRCRDVIVTVI
jgi:hypothetical protein